MVFGLFGGLHQARAQVVNGDFSGGGTGWTVTGPFNSTITFGGGQATATSDNNGGGASTTLATQVITTTDPGFLSYLLVSYASTDVADWDWPLFRVNGTNFRIATSGALMASVQGAGGAVTNATGATNLSGRTTLAAGTHTIGPGVFSVDSVFGAGVAVWDNIEFQQLTQSPAAQTTPYNTALTLSGVDAPQVATNSGAAIMSVTVSVTNGTLTLASTAGLTVGGNGTASVTLSGSPANINNALDGLVYTPNTGFAGAETLTFFASGGGISDTDTIGITVEHLLAMEVRKFGSVTVLAGADNSIADVGDTVSFAITIENTGTATLTSVGFASDTLTTINGDPLTLSTGPNFLSSTSGSPAGTLIPGEIATYTATYVLEQIAVDTGGVSNTATGIGTPPSGPAITDISDDPADTTDVDPEGDGEPDDPTVVTIPGFPSITITKVADDDTNVTTGQLITYTYTITNTGNQTVSDISLADVHNGNGPPPAPDADTGTLTDNAPAGGSSNTTTGDGDWDALGPGDVLTVTATYLVNQTDVDQLQ